MYTSIFLNYITARGLSYQCFFKIMYMFRLRLSSKGDLFDLTKDINSFT